MASNFVLNNEITYRNYRFSRYRLIWDSSPLRSVSISIFANIDIASTLYSPIRYGRWPRSPGRAQRRFGLHCSTNLIWRPGRAAERALPTRRAIHGRRHLRHLRPDFFAAFSSCHAEIARADGALLVLAGFALDRLALSFVLSDTLARHRDLDPSRVRTVVGMVLLVPSRRWSLDSSSMKSPTGRAPDRSECPAGPAFRSRPR